MLALDGMKLLPLCQVVLLLLLLLVTSRSSASGRAVAILDNTAAAQAADQQHNLLGGLVMAIQRGHLQDSLQNTRKLTSTYSYTPSMQALTIIHTDSCDSGKPYSKHPLISH